MSGPPRESGRRPRRPTRRGAVLGQRRAVRRFRGGARCPMPPRPPIQAPPSRGGRQLGERAQPGVRGANQRRLRAGRAIELDERVGTQRPARGRAPTAGNATAASTRPSSGRPRSGYDDPAAVLEQLQTDVDVEDGGMGQQRPELPRRPFAHGHGRAGRGQMPDRVAVEDAERIDVAVRDPPASVRPGRHVEDPRLAQAVTRREEAPVRRLLRGDPGRPTAAAHTRCSSDAGRGSPTGHGSQPILRQLTTSAHHRPAARRAAGHPLCQNNTGRTTPSVANRTQGL